MYLDVSFLSVSSRLFTFYVHITTLLPLCTDNCLYKISESIWRRSPTAFDFFATVLIVCNVAQMSV